MDTLVLYYNRCLQRRIDSEGQEASIVYASLMYDNYGKSPEERMSMK